MHARGLANFNTSISQFHNYPTSMTLTLPPLYLKTTIKYQTSHSIYCTLYECLRRCTGMCNDSWDMYERIMNGGFATNTMSTTWSCKAIWQWWTCHDKRNGGKLHGNISRNGYGNAIIGRYGGCFEEDIRRFMCERVYHITGFGCTGEVCTNSQCEKRQCTVPKRLSMMERWACV